LLYRVTTKTYYLFKVWLPVDYQKETIVQSAQILYQTCLQALFLDTHTT
jgi:hypothetical protein